MKRDEKDLAKREPAERVEKESFLERVEEKREKRRQKTGPLSGDEFLARSGKHQAEQKAPDDPEREEASGGGAKPRRKSETAPESASKHAMSGRETESRATRISPASPAAAAPRLAPEAVPPQAAMPITSIRQEHGRESLATRTESENIPSGEHEGTLFIPEEAEDFRARWSEIQKIFVDDPQRAVQEADALVESAVKRMSELLDEERNNLQRQRDRGEPCTTDQLRQLLQRYHSFFERLLAL